MKAKDLKPCPCCDGTLGIMPVKIVIERMMVDTNAVNTYLGTVQILGGHYGLADVMAPDNDLVKPLGIPKTEVLVCMTCFATKLGRLPTFEEDQDEQS